MDVTTPKHKRWEEFIIRLGGIEGCDFRKDDEGETIWTCAGGNNKPDAKKILRKMNGDGSIDIDGSLEFFDANGGHCDCEIVFNISG